VTILAAIHSGVRLSSTPVSIANGVCREAGLRATAKRLVQNEKARSSLQRFFAQQLRATNYFASRPGIAAALKASSGDGVNPNRGNWGAAIGKLAYVSILHPGGAPLLRLAPGRVRFRCFNHLCPTLRLTTEVAQPWLRSVLGKLSPILKRGGFQRRRVQVACRRWKARWANTNRG